jgi:integrase
MGGLLMAYLLERKLPSKSEAEFRAAYKRFTRIVGEHTSAKDVTKAQCREFKPALLASKLAVGSVKKLLGIVATIWNHAVSQGLVDSSPFTGLTKVSRQTDQTEGRIPYSVEQVRTLLTAAEKLHGAKRWLPWLAAWTGARLSELGGLCVEDVKEEQGLRFSTFDRHKSAG